MNFLHENKLNQPLIEKSTYNSAMLDEENSITAGALLLGIEKKSETKLLSFLDNNSLLAKISAWALGQSDNEEKLLNALQNASFDIRDNVYQALLYLVANNLASEKLTEKIQIETQKELKITQSGKTGLAEKTCAILALLGDESCISLCNEIMLSDKYCDRFELQRLKKAVSNYSYDKEGKEELLTPWQELFEEHLVTPIIEDEPIEKEEENTIEEVPEILVVEGGLDWVKFAKSDELKNADETSQKMVTQIAPILDQLAIKAAGKKLTECVEDEIVAIFTQVLPQALPQEYVQAALSPESIKSFSILISWLKNTKQKHTAIEDGIETIKTHIQSQLRASGSLDAANYE